MFLIEFPSLTDDAVIQLATTKLNSDLPEWEKNIWQFISNWFNPSFNSIQVFTSGSTGAPKKIEHSKQAMLNSARMTCEALQLHKKDTALLCLPCNKIAGMMMIVRSIYRKMNLLCIPPSAAPLNDLPEEIKISFAAFTPMQLYSAGKNREHFKRAEQIDKIILGGELISTEIMQTVTRLSNNVYHTFGMTETISHIALKKLNGSNADAHYKLLGDVKISTDDRNYLIIEAPTLEQPRLVTNDVVQIISNKEFDWLGRADNVINSGGIKIYPEELEQKLQIHIQSAFFISAMPDERTGQKLVLCLETNSLSENDKQKIKSGIEQVDKLHRPKSILSFKQFERTINGKIKRKETLQASFQSIELY